MDVKSNRRELATSDAPTSLASGEKSSLPNTFKMAPDKNGLFRTNKVKPIIDAVLKSNLENYKYDSSTSNEVCKRLVDEIKSRIKTLGFNRYKLVCQSFIISDKEQSVRVASRYLWDDTIDNFVSSPYNGKNFTAVVLVGAVYFE